MTNFDAATRRVKRCATQLVATGTPPTIVADALITQAMAAWQAETGRATAAREFLKVWTELRDGR